MKRFLVILLLLCPYVSYGTLSAQLHTTSSASYRSYTSGGGMATLPVAEFQSTSAYGRSMATTRTYSATLTSVANGTVRTVASSINGGVILGNSNTNNTGGNTIIPVIPGVPDTPLSFDWDSGLLLVLLLGGYACFIAYKRKIVKKV